MVEHYAIAVNQKKLAAAAILKWEAPQRRERARRNSRKVALTEEAVLQSSGYTFRERTRNKTRARRRRW